MRPLHATHLWLGRKSITHAPSVVARIQSIRRAFSLIELMVVIAVTVLLTALLMPALRHVHENANRVICLAHLQQMGQAFMMYSINYKDSLPYSAALQEDDSPPDLMAAQRPSDPKYWDGIGLLYAMQFCPSPDCFYCPSHRGRHTLDRYADLWFDPDGVSPIFTNYHYAGDVEWTGSPRQRRSLDEGHNLILATDGLRTSRDFNHVSGLNVLRGDGSVRWRDDTQNIRSLLPISESQHLNDGDEYMQLWDKIDEQ